MTAATTSFSLIPNGQPGIEHVVLSASSGNTYTSNLSVPKGCFATLGAATTQGDAGVTTVISSRTITVGHSQSGAAVIYLTVWGEQ